jgi:hypothetical protein
MYFVGVKGPDLPEDMGSRTLPSSVKRSQLFHRPDAFGFFTKGYNSLLVTTGTRINQASTGVPPAWPCMIRDRKTRRVAMDSLLCHPHNMHSMAAYLPQ